MTKISADLYAVVILDNGIERTYFHNTKDIDLADKDGIVDGLQFMRDSITTAYREDRKGSITVGNNVIAIHKTSSVNLSLTLYDEKLHLIGKY